MEFALVIPTFLLLVAGMIDLGVGLISYMTIINSAREGARVGATACGDPATPCSSIVTDRVTAAVGNVSLDGLAITCTKPDGSSTVCNTGLAKDGGSITVRVTTNYRTIWPLAFGATIPMTASAKFLVQ